MYEYMIASQFVQKFLCFDYDLKLTQLGFNANFYKNSNKKYLNS